MWTHNRVLSAHRQLGLLSAIDSHIRKLQVSQDAGSCLIVDNSYPTLDLPLTRYNRYERDI